MERREFENISLENDQYIQPSSQSYDSSKYYQRPVTDATPLITDIDAKRHEFQHNSHSQACVVSNTSRSEDIAYHDSKSISDAQLMAEFHKERSDYQHNLQSRVVPNISHSENIAYHNSNPASVPSLKTNGAASSWQQNHNLQSFYQQRITEADVNSSPSSSRMMPWQQTLPRFYSRSDHQDAAHQMVNLGNDTSRFQIIGEVWSHDVKVERNSPVQVDKLTCHCQCHLTRSNLVDVTTQTCTRDILEHFPDVGTQVSPILQDSESQTESTTPAKDICGNTSVPIKMKIKKYKLYDSDEDYTPKKRKESEESLVEDSPSLSTRQKIKPGTPRGLLAPESSDEASNTVKPSMDELGEFAESDNADDDDGDDDGDDDDDDDDDDYESEEWSSRRSRRKSKSPKKKATIKRNIPDTEEKAVWKLRKPFKCPFCYKRFLKEDSLINHKQFSCTKNRIKNDFICPECGDHFVLFSLYRNHLKTHSGKLYRCTCGDKFETYVNLKSHVDENHPDGQDHKEAHPYSCEKIFDSRKPESEALLALKLRKPFKCPYCHKRFIKEESLNNHTLNSCTKNRRGNSFICPECGDHFEKFSLYKRHLKTHTGEFYKCTCGTKFDAYLSLKTHVDANQVEGEAHLEVHPYYCKICFKTFIHQGRYKRHMITHDNNSKIACSVCGKEYEKHYMEVHERSHSGLKPYSCDQEKCDMTYPSKKLLQRHQRVHMVEFRLPCTFCDKVFTQKSRLKDHLRVHTGEKPYVCEVCGSSFSRTNHLRRHQLIHAKEDMALANQTTDYNMVKYSNPSQHNLPVDLPIPSLPGPDSPVHHINHGSIVFPGLN